MNLGFAASALDLVAHALEEQGAAQVFENLPFERSWDEGLEIQQVEVGILVADFSAWISWGEMRDFGRGDGCWWVGDWEGVGWVVEVVGGRGGRGGGLSEGRMMKELLRT